ncbi:GNAT family N-acetyltransferase [Lysobacter niastensis]|uniref:GNAT family N-acetyltransferase n=1 Tax=Lysobacter niastensis TaxID=380629 RepID=A0ABS0BCK5_9GAMM|nr:N-acetyltransferase [Lysobacter niastensis]MBF6025429.1 GNAT family N-acetyltransferase [Lysobacter niastensis]
MARIECRGFSLSSVYDDRTVLAIPPVRLATLSDARAIAELSRDSIELGLGWSYPPSRIQKAIRSRTTNVAVVHESGCLLGFGIMDYGDTAAHLVLLGVQPHQRRRGLGRHVLSWLEQCALTAGLERISIEARADNPGAIGFYQRQGYRVRGRVPGYYRGVLDAVLLEKKLGMAGAGGAG